MILAEYQEYIKIVGIKGENTTALKQFPFTPFSLITAYHILIWGLIL